MCCLLVLCGGPVGAQYMQNVPLAEMALSQLIDSAKAADESGSARKTIVYLEEILRRAETIEDTEAVRGMQKVRLLLGRTYLKLRKFEEAEQHTRKYLAQKSCPDRESAMCVLCQIAMDQSDWAALKKEGLMLLNEPGKTTSEQKFAELCLGQAYYHLKEFKDALPLLRNVLEDTEDPDVEIKFRFMLASGLFETGQTDELLALLPEMIRGDSRYDIAQNLLLLRIGDALFNNIELREALSVYRMILPRAEVEAWADEQFAKMERRLARLQEETADINQDDPEELEQHQEIMDKISLKMDELDEKRAELEDAPEYDRHVAYQIAQIYAENLRWWEAVAMYDRIYRNYPDEWEGDASALEKVVLLLKLEEEDAASTFGKEYLAKNSDELYVRLVAMQLTRHFFEKKEQDTALEFFGFSDLWEEPETSSDAALAKAGLRYIVGFIWLEKREYAKAADEFKKVILLAPKEEMATDSKYWIAMSSLLLQDYEDALTRFARFRSFHPDHSLATDALFRMGVSAFGLEQYAEAKAHFDEFISLYPKHYLVPEALGMRGDLLGAEGQLDEALADYRRSIDLSAGFFKKAPDPNAAVETVFPATYSLCQMSTTLDADAKAYSAEGRQDVAREKYEQTIDAVDHYIELFGDHADWAQGAYLKGKALINLGRAEEAVATYMETILKYGPDPAQDGVSSILYDLGTLLRSRVAPETREESVVRLRAAREETESFTLRLRLDVLLAQLDGTQNELGTRILEQEADLSLVPASAMGLMCSTAFHHSDFSRAEELFEEFQVRYSDSPYIGSAYRLRSEELLRQGRFEESLALATEVLDLFGPDDNMAWAQVMKGRSSLGLEKYDEAIEHFDKTFSVPQWRGPAYAEATFRTAEVWLARGDAAKAFAFFQRTYLLYSFYDEGRWAADAYLKSADCLYQLDRPADALNTYRAMLLDEAVCTLPQVEVAKEALGPDETAALLAKTNSVEAVSVEVNL